MTVARIIDYETTGTQEDDHAEIIEFGSIDVDTDARQEIPDTAWASFARPHGEIPAVTKAVHHITEDDVRFAPEALELFDYFLGCDGDRENLPPQYLVAHNARFEQHFTPDVGIPWICTYKVARVVWPDAPGHGNQALRYWLGLEVCKDRANPPHRALPDCHVTAALFIRLLGEKTPEQMVEISRYPALLRRITFGTKAKGQTYEEAPIDYLEWIRDKSDLDEDTKFSARYWIKKRSRQ